MNQLGTQWKAVGQTLGFAVLAPYKLSLPDGAQVEASALLPQFGATHGMLLFERSEQISNYAKAVVAAGYGYSVLSPEPSGQPDTDSIVEVLRDWGWSGPSCEEPLWLNEA